MAMSDTIPASYRNLGAHKLMARRPVEAQGRPWINRKVEQLIVGTAEENLDWSYDRIPGGVGQSGV